MENMFKFRTKDLQKKWEMAENAVQVFRFRATSKPQTTQATVTDTGDSRREIAATNKPYDDEAGF